MARPKSPSNAARVGAQGRVVLPSEVREAANLRQGDRLIVVVEKDAILLLTPAQAVKRVQAMARKYRRPGILESRELIRERREEVRREEAADG